MQPIVWNRQQASGQNPGRKHSFGVFRAQGKSRLVAPKIDLFLLNEI